MTPLVGCRSDLLERCPVTDSQHIINSRGRCFRASIPSRYLSSCFQSFPSPVLAPSTRLSGSGTDRALGPALVGHHSHATLRAFVTVFRATRGFFRAAVVFLFLGVASIGGVNSSSGCFAVRWWPWRSGWMRAASASIRSSSSLLFVRSSSRYAGIVLVVMARVWQNKRPPICPILATR